MNDDISVLDIELTSIISDYIKIQSFWN